jgi:hypothetical protein
LSSTADVHSRLDIYKAGQDDENDLLLNPARVLVTKWENMLDTEIGKAFTTWVQLYDPTNKEGGQYVVENYTGTQQTTDPKVPLYTRAPTDWRP